MNPLRCIPPAIFFSIAAFTSWVGGDVCIKAIGDRLPVEQIVLFNRIMAVLLYVMIARRQSGWHEFKTRKPLFHGIRGIINVLNLFTLYYAVRTLPLTNFYTLAFTIPLIIALISGLSPHERPTKDIWAAVVVGFAGVIVAIGPNDYDPQGWPLIPVISMLIANLCFVFYNMTIKWGGRNETSTALTFFPDIFVVAAMLLYMNVWGEWKDDLHAMVLAMIAGLFGGTANIFITAAYRRGKNAIVAPFHYTQIITGGLAGYVFWGDAPTWNTILGATIIIASGLYIAFHGSTDQEPQGQKIPAAPVD